MFWENIRGHDWRLASGVGVGAFFAYGDHCSRAVNIDAFSHDFLRLLTDVRGRDS